MRALTRCMVLAFVVLATTLVGCKSYYRCRECGSAYMHRAGFPGQFNLQDCRGCGAENSLCPCSKEESGWSDSRYAERGYEN